MEYVGLNPGNPDKPDRPAEDWRAAESPAGREEPPRADLSRRGGRLGVALMLGIMAVLLAVIIFFPGISGLLVCLVLLGVAVMVFGG